MTNVDHIALLPCIDPITLHAAQRVMGERFDELLARFETVSAAYMARIHDGYGARQNRAVADAAHPLKAASASLGFTRVSKLAALVEELALTGQERGGIAADLPAAIAALKTALSETGHAVRHAGG